MYARTINKTTETMRLKESKKGQLMGPGETNRKWEVMQL